MKAKWIKLLLAVACLTLSTGVVACGDKNHDGSARSSVSIYSRISVPDRENSEESSSKYEVSSSEEVSSENSFVEVDSSVEVSSSEEEESSSAEVSSSAEEISMESAMDSSEEDSSEELEKIEIQKIEFEQEEYIFDCMEENLTLRPIIYPANADTSDLTWSSSSSRVYPDEEGNIISLGTGTAVVTVTASNGVSASCVVTAEYCYHTIAFSKDEYTTTVGGTFDVALRDSPSYGNCALEYEFSDESVAAIDDYGCVVALKEGTTTLTIRTHKGLSATCTLISEKGLSIETPTCPTTVNNWSDPAYFKTQTAEITSVTCDIEKTSGTYWFNITIKGRKTWCKYSGSYQFKIYYELVDENNIIVDSGFVSSESCAVNQGFIITERIWIDAEEMENYGKNLKMTFSDVAW